MASPNFILKFTFSQQLTFSCNSLVHDPGLTSGTNIAIGGSDISINAIEIAQRQTLFAKNGQFYVISMTEKNELVPDNSKDLVISFGAFAMYLFKEEMIVALKEALRFQKNLKRNIFFGGLNHLLN